MSPRIPLALTWLWTHLLIENISNQRLPGSIIEDSINKPWRPLPSRRLAGIQALQLLQILVPFTLVLSFFLGAFTPSATLMTFIWLYNDLDAAGTGPCQRNIVNSAGLACFGWGAMSVLLTGQEQRNDSSQDVRLAWISLTAAVVATTVHTQDLPDIPGDKARGRKTMPLLYGEAWARGSLAVLILIWSLACLKYWNVGSLFVWFIQISIALAIIVLVTFRLGQFYDELSWKLWCIWATMLYMLPLFSRPIIT